MGMSIRSNKPYAGKRKLGQFPTGLAVKYNGIEKLIKFSELLMEDKGGKNLHLEHLEDEIINYGVDGGRAAINFLQSLRDMLAGSSRDICKHDS